MTKNLLTLSLIFFVVNLYSQISLETTLDSIQTDEDVISFIETNKSKNWKIITFNTEKHISGLAKDLYGLSIGSKKVYETEMSKTHYKVLDKELVPHYRMSYIMLDKNKLSENKFNNIKSVITKKYAQGYQFKDLAAQYSMDQGAKRGGDSGWFTKGTFYDEVEMGLLNNNSGSAEILIVDVPTHNCAYLILSDHSTKDIEELKILKVTENIK